MMSDKKKCGSCQLYTPSEKLPYKIFSKMCLKYDGWCSIYHEERDADEVICTHYKRRKVE